MVEGRVGGWYGGRVVVAATLSSITLSQAHERTSAVRVPKACPGAIRE